MPRIRIRKSSTSFGKKLKKFRTSRGWSQEILAGKADVSQVLICTLESGKKLPGWDTVKVLAKALDVRTDDFL